MKVTFQVESFAIFFLFLYNIFNQCHAINYFQQGDCSSTRNLDQSSEQLIDQASGKCYPLATKGPCGENMIFYRHPLHQKYGFCDCDQGFRSKFPCSDHPVRKMMYFPRLRKCFPIFSQGQCQDGYWLHFHKSDSSHSQLKCQPNPCITKQLDEDPNYDWTGTGNKFWYYDGLRKSCFLTQTQGYCPARLTLEVAHDSPIPRCKQLICYGKLTNFRSDLTCKPGSRFSYLWRGCIKRGYKYFIGIG